jgi:hypothetical protein
MLLLIGLELEPQALWQMRQRPFGAGPHADPGHGGALERLTHDPGVAPIAPGPDELP